MNRPMAATPAAPVVATSLTRAASTPPIARTGTLTARTMARSPSVPMTAAAAGFDGVAQAVPAIT
jgi:hypothetical protein